MAQNKNSNHHHLEKKEISICWLRRDLRLEDNAALYHALKGSHPVLLLFIFDKHILDKLENKKDARVTFIYQTLESLQGKLIQKNTSLIVKYGIPEKVWAEVLKTYNVKAVYTNHDYEPYATRRDDTLAEFLRSEGIIFHSFKDQVIFEKSEIVKADQKPYTVFTPYFKVWNNKLNDFYLKPYPSEKYIHNFFPTHKLSFPTLEEMGFELSSQQFPTLNFEEKLASYEKKRDYPAADATTHIGLHLRFGTVSIRKAAAKAIAHNAEKWLSELAWRDFYMMILWHFPHITNKAFKPAYDNIKWRNNEAEFKAWCEGKTGYPLVDAGMRQLNQTGFMHNRIRMVVASFLCKHLLIDWRWGEAYFADKLLDYELASNVGGWQWACGSGNDAAPYFRVFNPELQLKKFDSKMEYVFKWAPAYKLAILPIPIVEHTFARDRVLKEFKKALA
ncbi:cryptochrome/photolyase family protein [Pedobacter boryungensis]|uniref:Deoxyribodipyrimidine photo-lyase n=1 Tax=Pedobacter boryungensis TaxID=869962 RepID=A0ABX2DEQ9_9SPHI|nr:deoxyribodipyrimidine photo-lyase [Pedobacter boryungensis]NQX32049.1 deoxyribodipyrimidine photo-lyase [Pedobacter boryungensis]